MELYALLGTLAVQFLACAYVYGTLSSTVKNTAELAGKLEEKVEDHGTRIVVLETKSKMSRANGAAN